MGQGNWGSVQGSGGAPGCAKRLTGAQNVKTTPNKIPAANF